jgi:hypothetical protein
MMRSFDSPLPRLCGVPGSRSRISFSRPSTLPVLPTVEHNPEPVEGTRYLLSLLGPVLLAAALVVVAPRLRLQLPRRVGTVLAVAAQLVGVAVIAA